MKQSLRLVLSIMMFLEFFVWGSWFVTMGTYLGTELSATGAQIGQAYMTQAFGAIIAPFIFGLIADRFFSAQRLLGVLHLAGAVLLFMAASAGTFSEFYPYIMVYMILYMPTLALANAVSFHHLPDPTKMFAGIRIWGSIGWIAAGMLIGYLLQWEAKRVLQLTFYLATAASTLFGVYSFFLPDTPPQGKNEKSSIAQILGMDAIGLFRERNYLIFFISSVLICIPLAWYYQTTNLFLNDMGMRNAAGNMTWGQISEVALLLLLPIFLKRYGLKMTLLVGMSGWVLRYILFAYGDAGDGLWMLLIGILLHGVCYDFFFVSGQIYTDFKAGEEIKSSAQGLITLATYGVGMLIGFWMAGKVYDMYTSADGQQDWKMIWLIPAAIAALVLVLFVLTFKNEKIQAEKESPKK